MSIFRRFSKEKPRRPSAFDTQDASNSGYTVYRGMDTPPNRNINAMPAQNDEILIAVVGVTGSGKSSFIQRLTGRRDIEIGEGLCSMTQSVQEYSYSVAGKKFKIIDTPGFDDTEVDDEDIFEALVDWLEKSYRKSQRLTGLLYLHRIISNREKGSDLRNLRVFQKLCGDNSFSNVIIGITWWDKEDAEVADSREKVLKESDEFWGGMIKKGAQVVRMPLDQQGCVNLLMNLSQRQTTTLAVQDEVVNQGKKARDTNAASALVNYNRSQAAQDSDRLDRLAEDLRQKAQRLRQEQESAQRLAEERRRYEEEDERILAEAEALLMQKKREADAFRERTEARRKRMEEIQRQLREVEAEAEADNEAFPSSAQQQGIGPERSSPLSGRSPPPAYARELTPTTPVEYERVRPTDTARREGTPLTNPTVSQERPPPANTSQDQENRFTLPRLEKQRLEQERLAKEMQERLLREKRENELKQKQEEERRARVLAEQIENQRKAQAEARRLEQEKEAERKRMQEAAEQMRLAREQQERRIAAETQRAREEEERAASAYEQQLTDAFTQLFLRSLSGQGQAEAEAKAEAERQRTAIVNRAKRHIASRSAATLEFGAYAQIPLFRQPWQGTYHEIHGVRVAGPLQEGFCDFCMAAIPTAQGHWACDQCTTISTSGLAMCHECKASRQGVCFNVDHTLRFQGWSSSMANGPFASCNRLRERTVHEDMQCDKCKQRLSVVFLHCCRCNNDNFDLCMTCWGAQFFTCMNTSHTLYVHVWAPPNERLLL